MRIIVCAREVDGMKYRVVPSYTVNQDGQIVTLKIEGVEMDLATAIQAGWSLEEWSPNGP